MNRIRRITAYPIVVPIPKERVNCPVFFNQMLHRNKDQKEWNKGASFFAEVPFFAVKIEGDGGPAGWSDSSRMIDRDIFIREARAFLGKRIADIDPRKPMLDITEFNRLKP